MLDSISSTQNCTACTAHKPPIDKRPHTASNLVTHTHTLSGSCFHICGRGIVQLAETLTSKMCAAHTRYKHFAEGKVLPQSIQIWSLNITIIPEVRVSMPPTPSVSSSLPLCLWGNVCPARAQRATFLLTIPTSARDLPSDGEGPPNGP